MSSLGTWVGKTVKSLVNEPQIPQKDPSHAISGNSCFLFHFVSNMNMMKWNIKGLQWRIYIEKISNAHPASRRLFFIFMQFSGIFGWIIRWQPLFGLAPLGIPRSATGLLLGAMKSWDMEIRKYREVSTLEHLCVNFRIIVVRNGVYHERDSNRETRRRKSKKETNVWRRLQVRMDYILISQN